MLHSLYLFLFHRQPHVEVGRSRCSWARLVLGVCLVVWSRLHNTTSSPSSVAASSPHASLGGSGGSPDSCSFGSFGDTCSTITSSSTLAASPPDTAPTVSATANAAAHSSEAVDSSISDVAQIMLEMKSPVVWTADEAQHVEPI